MEKWKLLEKDDILFNVSNKGNLQVLGDKVVGARNNIIKTRNKLIKTLDDIKDFSFNGGHEDNRYLFTHGYYTHLLVAEAWIGPIPEGMTVNHKDLNKFNNEVENLEIISKSDNLKHAWENGAFDHLMLSQKEIDRRYIKKEIHKLNRQWVVLDPSFKILSTHDSQETAAKSIGVSRQSANNSFRRGKPILRHYYICKLREVSELKKKIGGRNHGTTN
ncbi:HNH endonuclease signature motif containing protein [Lederbergia citri]|uniref:HNH endonuclease n=1 Tax=Lederbergia citri TaxID=2833580 RepID=A0A942YEW6_9BACI|nr:HNH endonuclease signature motif containing protein [Lederbergia citri]MBS4194358.1 HNH endonuclease [Lederbergia citri]